MRCEWEFVRPLLLASLLGRKRLHNRWVLNGIVWKFRTGTAWRDVPERYGSWATLHTRFRRWAKDCTFERMHCGPAPRIGAASVTCGRSSWGSRPPVYHFWITSARSKVGRRQPPAAATIAAPDR
ncbi:MULTISPECIES: transposase [unclassified Streptomyces]|uniref:transposase n=1 Tax=unclassified Streptomyces TaxID=2593676 RepID=UPI0033210B8B